MWSPGNMRSFDLLQGPNKDWVILFFVALLAYVSTPTGERQQPADAEG
jgi:hypothetical protein